MLQRQVADALKAYVKGGGTLISEARPAWNDERGFANARIPGAGLDEVFGARERELRSGDAITFIVAESADGALAPLAGRTFNGTAFAEHLEIMDPSTRILARFPGGSGDAAAMTLSRYGEGRAILIGTFPSAAFEQDPEKMRATGELLQRLVAYAGVKPDVHIEGAPGLVEARFLESAGAIVLIALNHSDTAQKVTFSFAPSIPEAIWQNMETGSQVSFVQGPNGPTYTHTFGPRDAIVLVRGKRLQ
jgi:hypothetical protein